MLVLFQLVTVVVQPQKYSCPTDVPKLLPLIVTGVPTTAELRETEVMTGPE